MRKTLFNIVLEKCKNYFFKKEVKFDNLLKLKIGSKLSINEIEYKDLIFTVKKIFVYSRVINGKKFDFTDYELIHGVGKETTLIKLRCNPLSNPDINSGLTHSVLLLKLYFESKYDENIYNCLVDTTKIFDIMEGDIVQERYFRINDVQESYKASISDVVDEKYSANIEYWDYNREIKDNADLPLIQYLFVEMDEVTGWFQMWQGFEIDSQQVLI